MSCVFVHFVVVGVTVVVVVMVVVVVVVVAFVVIVVVVVVVVAVANTPPRINETCTLCVVVCSSFRSPLLYNNAATMLRTSNEDVHIHLFWVQCSVVVLPRTMDACMHTCARDHDMDMVIIP